MTGTILRQAAAFVAAIGALYVGTAALPSAPDPVTGGDDAGRTVLKTDGGTP